MCPRISQCSIGSSSFCARVTTWCSERVATDRSSRAQCADATVICWSRCRHILLAGYFPSQFLMSVVGCGASGGTCFLAAARQCRDGVCHRNADGSSRRLLDGSSRKSARRSRPRRLTSGTAVRPSHQLFSVVCCGSSSGSPSESQSELQVVLLERSQDRTS
jgi:hypothetical protein